MASVPVEIDTLRLEQRFHAGDHEAFRALVEPHLDSLYTVCLRMTGSAAEAEDVVQDALVRAMERHALYRPGAPLRPWILTIAINLCRGRLRSPWWKRVIPLLGTEEIRHSPRLDEALGAVDDDEKVRRALKEVPLIYREALSLFYLGDMAYQEMAEITGQGVPALKQRVRRGKEMLREILSQMYPDLVEERKSAGGGG
jgi:RNA polymerase sigma-70 factor (ECF subfamily)